MVTRDEPLKDVVGGLLGGPFLVSFTSSQSTLSMVRHESPPQWIFKNPGVLESQDADLESFLR